MTVIAIVALIIVMAVQWRRLDDLRRRLDEVEGRAPAQPAPAVEPPVKVAPVARPEPTPSPRPARVVVSRPPDQVAPPTPPVHSSRSPSFEDMFGRRLPIWAGGATLAVCGVLIVRYSIETGLLSPLLRVIAGLLFGLGLIEGAEVARRHADRVRDPRVPQALAGAGVATLFATTLIATDLYALIGPLTGFAGLALVTGLAAALSLRFGEPSAVLGLVGGLAAPALVGAGAPDVPLLSAYLALAIGGLATLGRVQRWPWLGLLAIAGGFGWGAVMLLTGALDTGATTALGLYLLLIGAALPPLALGRGGGVVARWAGTLAAAMELGGVMAEGGFRPLDWGLYALLSMATVWLSRRDARLADLPGPALAIALVLMLAWPHAAMPLLAIVLAGAGLIHGLPAVRRLWRADGRVGDAGALRGPGTELPAAHFDPRASL